MAVSDRALEHPKKRRRRELHPKTFPARLVLDDAIGGDNGRVSKDVWDRLCHGREGTSFCTL